MSATTGIVRLFESTQVHGMESGRDVCYTATALVEPFFRGGDGGCVRTGVVTRIGTND